MLAHASSFKACLRMRRFCVYLDRLNSVFFKNTKTTHTQAASKACLRMRRFCAFEDTRQQRLQENIFRIFL